MPASQGFGTDTDVMVASANRIFDVVDQIHSTATRMSGQLTAALNEATFVGAAATAFGNEGQGVHGMLRSDMNQLHAALDRLRGKVQESITEYLGGDDAGQAAVARSGAQAGAATAALKW
ncbi:type VII secretion target [Actinomycetes bacterium KLBMP 9797]